MQGGNTNYSNYAATTTETVSGGLSGSKYDDYGHFKNDFSSPDILNIMKKGTTGAGSGAITTVTPSSVTSTYTTGPVTTAIPGGSSTYEYSASYSVDPVGASYTESKS